MSSMCCLLVTGWGEPKLAVPPKRRPSSSAVSAAAASARSKPVAPVAPPSPTRQPIMSTTRFVAMMAMQFAAFAVILVVALSSDWLADVTYQCIGICLALVRIANPDSALLPKLLYMRIATRLLRPLSHAATLQGKFAAEGAASVSTIFVAANLMHDCTLLLVGASLLFDLPRQDLFRATYRESLFAFAIVRWVRAFGVADTFAVCTSAAEALATNSLLWMIVRGEPLRPRVVGFLSLVVCAQKLLYLFYVSP